MKVEILNYTKDLEKIIAGSARVCYSKGTGADLFNSTTEGIVARMIPQLIETEHLSTLEHGLITFGISGISRVTSHQLVRTREASYCQQSQRYVDLGQQGYVCPPSISNNTDAQSLYAKTIEDTFKTYEALRSSGVPAEDARYLLPNACFTNINVSMNPRILLHFFENRCCDRAQWEIREMANEMLRLCKKIAPGIFANAGPKCVTRGTCTEGAFSCGRYKSKDSEDSLYERFSG